MIDASAVIELLLRGPAASVITEYFLEGEAIHAPHLLDVEVLHHILRLVRAGRMDKNAAQKAIDICRTLTIERHSHVDLLDRAWYFRHNVTAYDAMYVALADILDATLLTADSRLAKAIPAHIAVELLPIR